MHAISKEKGNTWYPMDVRFILVHNLISVPYMLSM